MGKRTPYKIAKDKAWKEFSHLIRTRDCIRFGNSLDNGMCVTCKREYPYKELQAGHFIGGRGNAVLFDERIVYTQCRGCNVKQPFGKGGNYVEYFVFMEEEWGRDMIDEFRKLKHQVVKFKKHDLDEMREDFIKRRKQMIKEFKAKKDWQTISTYVQLYVP